MVHCLNARSHSLRQIAFTSLFRLINLRNALGRSCSEWPLSALPSLYVNYDANEETRFSGNFHFQRQNFVLQCMLIG